MPEQTILSYSDQTFVAFLDMCGFKRMMEDDLQKAAEKLKFFFKTIFETTSLSNRLIQINSAEVEISVIAVSDSAIIFPRLSNNLNEQGDLYSGLESLLFYIKNVNEELLKKDILTTTSIAYGHFEYRNTVQISNLIKNMFIGEPYLKAYLDSESNNPKLQPGECRILRRTLPNDNFFQIAKDYPNSLINNLRKISSKHLYFYWINKESNIGSFRKEYQKIFDDVYPNISKLFREHLRPEVT